MADHELQLVVRRHDETRRVLGRTYANSEVEVTASSDDLTEAFREVLSRLPNDVYAALKAAMVGVVPTGETVRAPS